MTLTAEDGTVKTALTGSFGYYRFDGVAVGQTVLVSVYAKRFTFSESTRLLNVGDNMTNVDFIAEDLTGGR